MPDARLKQMFDHETGSTLRLALLVIGVSSLGYVPAHLRSGRAGAPLLALVTAIVGGTFLATWLWTRTHPVQPRFSNQVFSLVIFITACNATYSQVVVGDALWTTNITIITIGAGMCIVAWRWSLATALASMATWFFFAAPPFGSAQWRSGSISVLFGFFAAGIINTGRRHSLARLLRVTQEAERAAVVDSLTQVYNRRGLALVASHIVRTARRTGEPVGVLVVDVDRFKAVNDKLGHQAGDRVLVAVAQALQATGRDSDVVARWGGDEFVVITLGAAPDADDLAHRVEQDLFSRGIAGGNGQPIRVSVGTANVAAVVDPDAIDVLIAEADAEMYAGRAQRRSNPGPVVARASYQKLSTGR